MEEFRVKCDQVRQTGNEMQAYRMNLSDSCEEIESIQRGLRRKISQYEIIGPQLKTIVETIENLNQSMDAMSRCLDRTNYYYQRAEDRITGQSNILKEILAYLVTGSEAKGVFSAFGIDGTWSSNLDFMNGGIVSKDGSAHGEGAVIRLDQALDWGVLEGTLLAKILSGEFSYAITGIDEHNIGASIGGNAEGSVGKLEIDGSLLNALRNHGEIAFLTGAVSGRAGMHLIRDDKPSPGVYISTEAGGSALHISDRLEIDPLGTDSEGIYGIGEIEGDLLGAEAYAKAGVGYLGTDADGSDVYGLEAGIGAEYYLAKGTISSGFNLFGIEVKGGLTGKIGGAGAELGGGMTNQGIDISGGLGLGAGVGVELSIDWTNFENPFK
ncbi:hypothetical protein D3Z51_06290 [Clostridiaceae bacterium]|nr:hypothetical protein [Clostridiaceae bacterium]RKI17359.1 hypothetical protein D7V81_02355 [bacterium 1XD21-70]